MEGMRGREWVEGRIRVCSAVYTKRREMGDFVAGVSCGNEEMKITHDEIGVRFMRKFRI